MAAKRIIGAAGAIGAGFLFVSSQTSCANAPTAYGRIKWHIERLTLEAGGWVVRPGQVYGGPEQALFGILCSLVRRLPIVPAFLPTPYVQPIHLDDLVKALLACLALKTPTVICVAAPQGIGFAAFLTAIARGRTIRRPMIVPVPRLLILTVAELLGPKLSGQLGLTQIRSLFALRQMHTASNLQQLSLELRPLSSGMTRSGRGRRGLLREGRAMLTYMLQETPASVLVRRYVRAIETLSLPQALQLPELVLDTPNFLSLLDGAKGISTTFQRELNWRLTAALMLSEASPQGAFRFLGRDKSISWCRSVLRLIRTLVKAIFLRALQRSLRPLLSRVGRSGTYR